MAKGQTDLNKLYLRYDDSSSHRSPNVVFFLHHKRRCCMVRCVNSLIHISLQFHMWQTTAKTGERGGGTAKTTTTTGLLHRKAGNANPEIHLSHFQAKYIECTPTGLVAPASNPGQGNFKSMAKHPKVGHHGIAMSK